MAHRTNDEENVCFCLKGVPSLWVALYQFINLVLCYLHSREASEQSLSLALTRSERSICRRMPASRVHSLYSPSFSFMLRNRAGRHWGEQVRNETELCVILHPCLNFNCVAKVIWLPCDNVCAEKLTPQVCQVGLSFTAIVAKAYPVIMTIELSFWTDWGPLHGVSLQPNIKT